ncbi:MAG TPA: glycosyltransferase [Parafilimonas sp.]|nr:glycosyltransferase [Parafilimonas sp.]
MPLISICIPAYKKPHYLSRLLDSISIQTFKDFEVIISDDSPDFSVKEILAEYENKFLLKYYRNQPSLGTPANWNFAISKAVGKWIKLMHDDDWFANEKSLELFALSALNSKNNFIFSGFIEVKSDNNIKKYVISYAEKLLLKKSPLNLFKKNFIGHPSTTLIKNNRQAWYDENIKWVVDFEFYIRCLKQTDFFVIEKPIINIGIHHDQVTKTAFRNPKIEIPENLYLISKLGENSLRNVFVYDYYWRLFRNLEMRTLKQVIQYSSANNIPKAIVKMLEIQAKIPLTILKIGLVSKGLMLISKHLVRPFS